MQSQLALSHGCALPCCDPFLIGNLPRRLLPRFSAGVAPHRGLRVTLLVPRVHAVAPGPGSSVGAEGVVDPGGGSIPRALLRFLSVCYYPKPAHKPHPPVLLGGHAPTGLQRVARYADE